MWKTFLAALCLGICSAGAQSNLWTGNFTNGSWLNDWFYQGGPKTNIIGLANTLQVSDTDAPGRGYLRVSYPANSYAPSGWPPAPIGGAQFYGAVLGGNGNPARDALTLQYAVRFPSNFNFVLGGKLPGLYGGAGNTGSNTPTGLDGFTTRHMWRTGGAGEAFPFLPTAGTNEGTSLGRGNWFFLPDNQWHTLRQELTLNEINAATGLIRTNGQVRVWYDNHLVLDAPGLLMRTVASLKIDGVLFQTFFGGGDTNWATPVDTYADFAAFSISSLSEIGSLPRLSNYQATVMSQNPAYYFQLDGSLTNSGTNALSGTTPSLSLGGSGGGYAPDYFANRDRGWFFSETNDALVATNDLINGGGHTPDPLAKGNGSLSVLFRTLDSANNVGQVFLFSQGTTNATKNALALFFENTTNSDPNSLKLLAGNTNVTLWTAGQFQTGTWYYFALTYNETNNANEAKWYLGAVGGALSSGDLNLQDNAVVGDNGPFYLGNTAMTNHSYRTPYNGGRIDEFAVWNRELAPTEVSNQFNAAFPLPRLTIGISGKSTILSWPTNCAPGLVLKSTPGLSSSNWSLVGSASIVSNQYSVTDSAPRTNRFYRVSKP